MTALPNHYRALGVRRSASRAEIRAAYLALSKRLHPDVPGGSAEAFAPVAEAWAVLEVDKTRGTYNQKLDLLLPACAPCSGRGSLRTQAGFTKVVERRCDACGGSGRVDA